MTNIFFILLLLFANLLLFLNHKKFAKIINIYDEPDSFRKIHKYPTPLIGGFYLITNLIFFIFFSMLDKDFFLPEIIISNNHLDVDWVVCGDDNKKGKPFPDPGLQILENFNINADQMLYVGDMIFDLQFAQNLGAHFIHFNNQKENYLPKNLANNIYSISKLIEIKKLVTKL